MFENPKGSPFQIFRHYETVQNCHFSSDIRFSKYISTNIFLNTIRNLNVISGVKRYIRIFDVISEVYSVLLRRRLAFVPAAISELLKRFPSTEGFLWVNLFCEFFMKKRHEHILKILHFLSLRYSTDFGRSRLVSFKVCFRMKYIC